MIEIAQKIVRHVSKWAGKKLERKHKVLKLLKALDMGELKKDIESVYAHALVEYSVDANPVELTLLFAAKPVKQAFQQDLYKNHREAFEKALEGLLGSGKVPIVPHIYKTAADLKPEVQRFQEFYDHFTLQSATSFQLKQYSELNRFMMKTWEEMERKSFDYQAEQYLKLLKDAFQKEFLDKNHYIDLNGETREYKRGRGMPEAMGTLKEKETGGDKETEEGKEPPYQSTVYNPLDRFIHQWLREEDRNFLVILGEYGTGKTTFLRHLAHRMAVHRLEPGANTDAPDEKYRIPLYFPLRDFEKKMEPYIVDQFSKEGITDIDYSGFLRRMNNDELVVMLDGFDEMTQKVDADEKSRNFEKIRRLIDSSEKSKIILTVRREYFQSVSDIEAVFQHSGKTNYQLIHLLPFDDEQIQRYLKTHTELPGYYWEQIETVFDLHDLAKRPVLLQLIVDYLPEVIEIKGKNKPIAASDLYDKCIRGELRRKSNELVFIIPNKYRVKILEKVAVWMFLNDQLSFDTKSTEIRRHLRRYFKIEMEWEFEKYLNEFLTFSFLIREADYRYRISHKSFRDYLTARAFVREINGDKLECFARIRATDEINRFIIEQRPDANSLLDLILSARNLSEGNQWQGTNAANILLKIDNTLLKNLDLSDCRLAFVDFRKCNLRNTIFQEADLSECRFNETVLSAQFENTNVKNSRLDLSHSDLTQIPFIEVFKDLSYLNLGHNQLSSISVLEELKSLTHLYLHDNHLTDISAISELRNLTYLNLRNNQIAYISSSKNLKKLTYLNLKNNQITDISAIKELKHLTFLHLYNNQITDISALKELKDLTELYLNNNNLSDISALKKLKNLTELYLNHNYLTNISALKDLKHLTQLILSSNKLTDVSALTGLKNLKRLDLYNNRLTDISALKELKHLETLFLEDNPLSKAQTDALKKALPNLKDFDF